MNRTRRDQSDVQLALSRELDIFQRRMAALWSGREREATIILVRLLDSICVDRFLKGAPEGTTLEAHFYPTIGATAALRPFLSVVKGQPGGVPWGPTPTSAIQIGLQYLEICGRLTHLHRMAALEHYGLASTSLVAPDEVVIKVSNSSPELAALSAFRERNARNAILSLEQPLLQEWSRLHVRMKAYVDTERGWFIRYKNDFEIVSAYCDEANRCSSHFREGEALPNDVTVGDRTFGDWKHVCHQALGRILAHIDFCLLLKKKDPRIDLKNIFTLYVRRDDIAAVWEQSGLRSSLVKSTMRALSLDCDQLDDWENSFEMPCPFYVDLGKDFVLAPCFGALTNSYFSLFRHLRTTFKSDWDRGVDRREDIFRDDLRNAFPEPRFVVPPKGFKIRRNDRSVITDIDAIIVDRQFGSMALIQLKWHDIFGRSLAERESRRRNIAHASKWVDRVSTWINGRAASDVALALGINMQASSNPPLVFVLARYNARFSKDQDQDPRATWLAWPELQNAIEGNAGSDILAKLPSLITEAEAPFREIEQEQLAFRFPNLTAHLFFTPEI